MRLNRKLLLTSLLLSGVAYSSASMASEPTLDSILKGIANTTWTQTTFSALSSASWNQAGSILDFNLTAEYTYWANSQTFVIKDGSTPKLIFAGLDNPGATLNYTLKGSLTSATVVNPINPNDANLNKVFVSSTGIYAFAHEDWTDNDYNDMVVSLKVTPAQISAVPEPKTYAMLVAGLLGIGFMARKKNKLNIQKQA